MKSSFFWTVFILLFVSAASASSRRLISQAPSITLQEPQLGIFVRVDAATGALSNIEAVKKFGFKKGRVSGFGKYLYTTYIDGDAASPVRFSFSETQTFAVRLTGRTPETLGADVRLMQLTVQDGKRFLTKAYVPLDVQNYGQLVYGLNPHAPKLGAMSFKVTPLVRLAPGEYALGESYSGDGFGGAYAFGIDGPSPSGTAR